VCAAALASILAAGEAAAEAPADCRLPAPKGPVADVRDHGAKGDGRADDTGAIQRAIDRIAGTGGTVRVPGGTYLVDAAGSIPLKLRSNMTLALDDGATLKVIPNGKESYSTLLGDGVANVTITGGTIEGDRDRHGGKSGEWGMGVKLVGPSRNVSIADVTVRNMWGDGIYISGASNVRLCSVTAERNRRQGLSVIAVDGLLVSRSVFRNTGGTRPGAGIDMEPNGPGERIADVRIEGSKFIDNAGGGILVAGKRGEVSNVAITGNVFEGREAIDIEYAPGVKGSGICRNRHFVPAEDLTGGLSAQAAPARVLIVQTECGDKRFYKRKKK
jgi:hypothetical protein